MAINRVLCGNDCVKDGVSLDECVGYTKLRDALQAHFKYDDFRPGQLEAVLPVVHGRDVFVCLPTGGGKSLCIFLALLAISDRAIAIVVSPLISLMDQQVKLLADIGVRAIRACSVDSCRDVAEGKYQFVFFAPESLQEPAWRKIISSETFKDRLALVAIDEAHCISEWGKDFRTDFEKIGGLRALTSVPFIALTASAPPDVRATIVRSLHLNDPVYVEGSLDRPNIYMTVSTIKGVNRDLNGLIGALKSSTPESVPKTIVFTQSKDLACKIVCILQRVAAKRSYVDVYHASLTQRTKSTIQDRFSSANSNLRCLVATIAFGMGMDIPDVEVVVVYGAPKTATQLYQLFGRAGRNGCPSRGHLFYSNRQRKKNSIGDAVLSQFAVGSENCRRQTLICGMGGTNCARPMERCCDVCTPEAIMSHDRLNVLEIGKAKKRVAVRVVNEELSQSLREQLMAERDKYLEENPCFRSIGANFVCPDVTIDELCSQAEYIQTCSDITLFGVRSDLKDRFFNVISSVLTQMVCRKRHRRM